jgi:hypothetical protein
MTSTKEPNPTSPAGRATPASRLLAVARQARAARPFGLIVVFVGLVVIGVGWNGAAGPGGEVNHVPLVQAQLPWLLSGGFLGLAIVVVGAALIVADSHRQAEARLASRMDALLDALEKREAAPAWAGEQEQAGSAEGAVLAGSASYHRPGCRLARRRPEARLIPRAVAEAEGLSPCRVCHPRTAALPGGAG